MVLIAMRYIQILKISRLNLLGTDEKYYIENLPGESFKENHLCL